MMIIIIMIIIDKWYTHTSKLVCEHEDMTVLWNQGVNTDRELFSNQQMHKHKLLYSFY
jgi:hypothetical protein